MRERQQLGEVLCRARHAVEREHEAGQQESVCRPDGIGHQGHWLAWLAWLDSTVFPPVREQ
ncbi:MAG: hypothetical protein WBO37_07030 [Gammaproteobacteria bacterium]